MKTQNPACATCGGSDYTMLSMKIIHCREFVAISRGEFRVENNMLPNSDFNHLTYYFMFWEIVTFITTNGPIHS